ncbi:MAG: PDR/VanB family oxidoreductase [Saprospiraceae bacterium]
MRYRNIWMDATIIDVTEVADNVRQIKIQPLKGTQAFTVGAHLDVSVYINDLPEIRSYSLIGQFVQGEPYTVCVKRLENSRGGSVYMWQLKVGDKLSISTPVNHFELIYKPTNYLLIAGGIGITPLIGMAETLSNRENTKVTLVYVGKYAAAMPYLKRLENLLGDNLILHCSQENGRIDIQTILKMVGPKTLTYLCGPLSFMNSIRQAWEESGRENVNLRYETFGASGLFAPQAFKVKIPRFNIELEVPKHQSLLQVLQAADIDIMFDCEKGECGLCQVDILTYTGEIDHRDYFFSENEKGENKKMCACISRVANGNLVIDTAYRGTS